MTHLVWFRNDLRASDNSALYNACKNSDSSQAVIACFIATPDQWADHDWSPSRIRFVVDHANELSQTLAKLGIPMHFITTPDFSAVPEKLAELCRSEKVTDLYFNEEYGVHERRRDKAVLRALGELDVRFHRFRDQTIVPVDAVTTKQGDPYSVYTPYSRSWKSWVEDNIHDPLPNPASRGQSVKAETLPSNLKGYDSNLDLIVPVGEASAHEQLEDFVDERIRQYHNDRDFPAVRGTSKVSPYLTNGVLSPRQCWHAARQESSKGGNQEGLNTWIGELAWRDFYIQILFHHPRVSMHKPYKPETDKLEWNGDGDAFKAWQEGRTGIPIVDAAMRQLSQTGWMHNRLRMVVAMFLTKNLWVDWRLGERHFMNHLIDGFLASNNGGWQWSASTGTDAVPYFRVFNPTTQSERFDPDGEFIRHFVPELKDLDAKAIHNPYDSGKKPANYPEPIVDLKQTRKDAIARFKALGN